MKLENLLEQLPEYARDVKLNLSAVLTPEGAPGLSEKQLWAIALSCAVAARSAPLIECLELESNLILTDADRRGARLASVLMAMNNVYYRTMHLLEGEKGREIAKMPARLRMNGIASPGVPKIDFELNCLAVSSIAGCGACVNSHAQTILSSGLGAESVHSSIRIAAIIQSAALAVAFSPFPG